jgi:site-specific recombinase XerD
MTTDLLPNTRALIARSPFQSELTAFVSWLIAERYTPLAVHRHSTRVDAALPRLAPVNESRAYAASDLNAAFALGHGSAFNIHGFQAARRVYTRFLWVHGRLLEPKADDRFASLRRDYDQYLTELRGLSASARSHHAHTVADFLVRGVGSRDLSALTQGDVEAFVVLRSRELSRHSMQHVVAHVRSFLRFCYDRGQLTSRLDENIDTPRTYRGELPPRALAWSAVQALLASISRAGKSGWRDYCILHLIAHYGLRPSEVVSLRLDSIDWERQTLRVTQHKTRSALTLPLAPATIGVLSQYLAAERDRQGRTHPELFLRARCPNGPLLRTAIGDIFEKRLRQAKIGLTSHDAYSLRHAFAMHLLARGVGVKVIGDLLGHRRLDTTCTYLRLDIEALRGVALAVPRHLTRSGGRHAQS